MNLNKRGRDELRTKVAEKLKDVPKGKRVILDSKILDQLLFETIVLNHETKEVIKLPYWSGEFLSKIDLSEVDFSDVSWGFAYGATNLKRFFESELSYGRYLSAFGEIFEKNRGLFCVNYSNTNTKIDFSKSFETKHNGTPSMVAINFSGVDFSHMDLSDFDSITDCDLSNTGINVNDNFTNNSYSNVIFDNVDFGKITLSAEDFLSETSPFSSKCYFVNSRLSIIYNLVECKKEKGAAKYFSNLGRMIKNGKFNGCYINGKLIKSEEERCQLKEENRIEYQKYIQMLSTSISTQIDGQVYKLSGTGSVPAN